MEKVLSLIIVLFLLIAFFYPKKHSNNYNKYGLYQEYCECIGFDTDNDWYEGLETEINEEEGIYYSDLDWQVDFKKVCYGIPFDCVPGGPGAI